MGPWHGRVLQRRLHGRLPRPTASRRRTWTTRHGRDPSRHRRDEGRRLGDLGRGAPQPRSPRRRRRGSWRPSSSSAASSQRQRTGHDRVRSARQASGGTSGSPESASCSRWHGAGGSSRDPSVATPGIADVDDWSRRAGQPSCGAATACPRRGCRPSSATRTRTRPTRAAPSRRSSGRPEEYAAGFAPDRARKRRLEASFWRLPGCHAERSGSRTPSAGRVPRVTARVPAGRMADVPCAATDLRTRRLPRLTEVRASGISVVADLLGDLLRARPVLVRARVDVVGVHGVADRRVAAGSASSARWRSSSHTRSPAAGKADSSGWVVVRVLAGRCSSLRPYAEGVLPCPPAGVAASTRRRADRTRRHPASVPSVECDRPRALWSARLRLSDGSATLAR